MTEQCAILCYKSIAVLSRLLPGDTCGLALDQMVIELGAKLLYGLLKHDLQLGEVPKVRELLIVKADDQRYPEYLVEEGP